MPGRDVKLVFASAFLRIHTSCRSNEAVTVGTNPAMIESCTFKALAAILEAGRQPVDPKGRKALRD